MFEGHITFVFRRKKRCGSFESKGLFWRAVLIKDSFHFVLGIFYCPLLVFINVRKCPWWGPSRTVAFCFYQGLPAQCSAHLHSHKADAQFHQIRAAALKAQCPGIMPRIFHRTREIEYWDFYLKRSQSYGYFCSFTLFFIRSRGKCSVQGFPA